MPFPAVESSEASPSILLGHTADGAEVRLRADKVNRHTILTGVTGTGKTETLKTDVIELSGIGVPTFLPDVKGDLESIARVAPVKFWDLSGERGETIMVSVRDMGAMLFSRILGLNEAQKGVVTIMFAVARKQEMALNTFDDVRAILSYMDENKGDIAQYGHVDVRTMGTIRRTLLELEEQNADQFFGPTTFSLDDLMQTHQGRGVVNILRADTLIHSPAVYSCFLLWLLNELFRKLPEVGDLEKPKLVFFFDEAHLLFDDAPKAFVQAVEKIVRLIRSKGVGIGFVSQTLADIPDSILAQLSNQIQHRLNGATVKERKSLQAAADSLPVNPKLGPLTTAIEKLGTGWALVSVLDQNGVPSMVEKVRIRRIDIPADGPPILSDRPETSRPVLVQPVARPDDVVVPFRRPEPIGGFLDTSEAVEPTEPREVWEEGRAPAQETLVEPQAALPAVVEPRAVQPAPTVIEPLLPPVQAPQVVTVQDHGLYAGRDVHIGSINVVHEAPRIEAPVIETPAWAKPKAKRLGTLHALRHTPLLVLATATFWAASALLPIAVTVGSQTIVI